MKIGFTTSSFRQFRDKAKIVRIARDCGADIMEWSGNVHVRTLYDARCAKLLCDAAGIGISSYGSYYRVGAGSAEEWRKVRAIAAEMGCAWVRVWLGTAGSGKTDAAAYRSLVTDARSVCDDAAGYGLNVCCECHDRTYNDDTDAFLRLREEVGRDNFKTYFQSRYRKKEYDLDRIERTLPYIGSVHISYSEQRREQFPKYDGAYLDALLERLLLLGYDDNLLLEFTYLCGYYGVPSCMANDMKKIKERVGCK
ncbi:MAG: TIM barrel protein [Clostridia bacterium]|nr:TIM barrel protein [Clostridia bacterium]